jgi:hypothetical protein
MVHGTGLTASVARISLTRWRPLSAARAEEGAMHAGPTAQPRARTISRRNLFKYGAATGAAATVAATTPAASAHTHGVPRVLPAPTPIPGGVQIPGGPLLHVFLPGPPEVTLPFTGTQLQGLDVEPAVITDYRGVTALAYLAGSATGSDGNQYNLEADMRAMEGTYVATDGTRQRGLFAFI